MLNVSMLSTALAISLTLGPEPADDPLAAYAPREIAGFTVLVHPAADEDPRLARRVIAALTFDLELIVARVPEASLDTLRRTSIVVTPRTRAREGLSGRGMCFHASAGWLTANGYDAAREGTVEILNMGDFLEWRAEQPMMTLHELAHAMHWRTGFDREDIRLAFEAARDAGRYEAVAHALAGEGELRRAYAMVNDKEYFAELSEAIFGRNDFFPFTADDLRAHDPDGYAVVARVWGLSL